MEQFLDADNKWHITLIVNIPRVIVKNKLNFRLHSIVMKDGGIIRDPSIASSNYIFGISTSFLGKKVFFFSFFDAIQIEDVVEFKFGLCDEGVRWYGNTITSIKNGYFKTEIIENKILDENTKPEKSNIVMETIEKVELNTTNPILNTEEILGLPLDSTKIDVSFIFPDVAIRSKGKNPPLKRAGRRKK